MCAVLVLGLWMVHSRVLGWALESALESFCQAHGFHLESASVQAQLGRPIRIDRIVASGASASRIVADRVEISLASPVTWFSKSSRLLERVKISGVSASLNGTGEASAGTRIDLRWMPRLIELEGLSVDRWNKDRLWAVRGLSATLNEQATAQILVDEIELRAGDWSWVRGSIRGVTAWKNGTVWIGNAALEPEVVVEEFSMDLLDEKGPGISILAEIFGGSVRGDFTLGERMDAAVWVSNVPVAPLPGLIGLHERMGGRIVEGRLTFRGDLARPADAEASLRLYADGFRWNDRGWESLEVGASLIHQRLIVTDFDFRQKENQVNLNGEVSIAEGWAEISRAPFLANLRASIQNLDSLGDLLGGSLNELSGRMSATGSVSGRDGQLDGFLSVESSGIGFRKLPVKSLKLEAVFRRNEVEIAQCDVYSGEDFLNGRGTLGLKSPHAYVGELRAKIGDLAKYLRPFRAPGADVVYAGALDARWQGDGTWRAHSGAFDLRLARFVSDATPAGITGQFVGTYSPQNIYFSSLGLENGSMRLDSRVTLASSGVTIADGTVKNGATVLLEGSGFFPLDPFATLSGTDWTSAVDGEREAYLRIASPRPSEVADLLRLLGRRPSWQGELKTDWEARGLAKSPKANGRISIERLRFEGLKAFSESTFQFDFTASEGNATGKAALSSRRQSPITIEGKVPLGLTPATSGPPRWINPDGAFDVRANLPRADLVLLRPFLPIGWQLTGIAAGTVRADGTLAQPRLDGRIEIANIGLALSRAWPAVTDASATWIFEGNRARLEQCQGTFGGGPFTMGGSVALPEFEVDLSAEGRGVLLSQDRTLRLRADIDLHAKGRGSAGELTGNVRLVEGKIQKRLEVTPFAAPPVDRTPRRSAVWLLGWSVPHPFRDWVLDLHIRSVEPILVRNDFMDGALIPELSFEGTLQSPVPVGRVRLRDVRAFFPFAVLDIPDATVDFFPDSPGMPVLDIAGKTNAAGYEVQAHAFGDAAQNKLLLRSEPDLSQESLLVLLKTGRDPNAGTEGRFGSKPNAPQDFSLGRSIVAPLQLWGQSSSPWLRDEVTYSWQVK